MTPALYTADGRKHYRSW